MTSAFITIVLLVGFGVIVLVGASLILFVIDLLFAGLGGIGVFVQRFRRSK